jgi:hypothetical protein
LFDEKGKSRGSKGWGIMGSIVWRKTGNVKEKLEVDSIDGVIRRGVVVGVSAGLGKVMNSGRMRRGATVHGKD